MSMLNVRDGSRSTRPASRFSPMLRRAAALTAAAATVVTLAACGAGQHAETAQEKPTIDGTLTTLGPLSLGGIGLQAPVGAPSWAPGSNVPLDISISNNGKSADTLTSVSSPRFAGWGIVPTSSLSGTGSPTPLPAGATKPVTIPAGGALTLSLQNLGAAGSSATSLVLTGLKGAALYPGTPVPVTLRFSHAGSTTLSVPVKLTGDPGSA